MQIVNNAGVRGHGYYELFGPDGLLKQRGEFENLITRVGDQYYADRAANIVSATATTNAVTNVTQPVITTDAAHGFGVGDVVTLAGLTAATTNLNGDWAIVAVPSTTSFTINCGVAPGAVSDAVGTAISKASLPKITGMKLGTDATAAAKTGAGSYTGSYTSGSNRALDTDPPTSALNGSSRRLTYVATWAAGVATASGLAEVVLTNQTPFADDASTAANTIARALLSPVINKAAADSLVVTWYHDLLGA